MKRLLIVIGLWLSHMVLSHAWAYTIETYITPVGAGSVSSYEGINFSEGAYVGLNTYGTTGFQFIGWYDEDNNLLSSESDYFFIMPAHNVILESRYLYDPEAPGNPTGSENKGSISLRTLSVCSVPAGAAWFNIVSTEVYEGNAIWISAFNFTNFYFQRWEDADGNLVSDEISFEFTMPDHDVMLYCYSEFNPDAPGNPDSGISDAVRDGALRVWPLPMRDALNVEVSGEVIETLTLTAITGKRVLTTNGPTSALDVSGLPPGIYILTATTPHSTHTKKLLKK